MGGADHPVPASGQGLHGGGGGGAGAMALGGVPLLPGLGGGGEAELAVHGLRPQDADHQGPPGLPALGRPGAAGQEEDRQQEKKYPPHPCRLRFRGRRKAGRSFTQATGHRITP